MMMRLFLTALQFVRQTITRMPRGLRASVSVGPVAVVAFLLWLTMMVGTPARADAEPGVPERVAALLARMTLEEKIGQLNLVSAAFPIDSQLDTIRSGRVGAMLNVVDPGTIARIKQAAAETRLAIPLLIGLDAIDVFRIAFPPPIAWAATFRPELAEAAARAIARETAATGINWTFAPMVDISRDPRWGRVIEGAGEDPYLGSVFAAARTRGYRSGGLMPTAKHYVGYGAGESGRDYNSALIPVSDLYDRHLPPFKAAIDAGALTVMAALNAINGVPATANRFLLEQVLRRDVRFTGLVSSDYNAIGELMNHGLAGDLAQASRIALAAGIDLDMEGYGYEGHLAAELAAGRVTLAQIDTAVGHVLSVKFAMGLFEAPRVPPVAPPEAETRATARQVARESIVLLKNDNAVLPIATGFRTIALIGAAATSDQDESWYGPALLTKPETQTLKSALEGQIAPGQTLLYAPAFTDHCGKVAGDTAGAVATASSADVVVFIVAEDCEMVGEGTSRTSLDLQPAQQDMLDRLAKLGKPLVLVVTAGRPLTLAKAATQADAIVFGWRPGTEGRAAMAEVLTGAVVPSGKLPMTFPRSVGQIPISYNVLPTSRPANENRYTSRYLDEEVSPLYPFGHGLSYTTFAYANPRPMRATVPRDGVIGLEVEVTNSGGRSGEEVVQLYTRQPVASRSRPLRELRGFQKIRLVPGETRTVRFDLRVADLAFHDDEGRTLLEPGPILFFIGGSSAAGGHASFIVE